jgi:NifU-like protein involved in Fe-S cluster formation
MTSVFSERLMRLVHASAYRGTLEEATHYGQAGVPGEGPYLQLWLRVEGEVVVAARWQTYGCPAAMACGEAVCQVGEGRRLALLQTLTAPDVARLVGGVPEGKEHCPKLAAQALAQATTVTSRGTTECR